MKAGVAGHWMFPLAPGEPITGAVVSLTVTAWSQKIVEPVVHPEQVIVSLTVYPTLALLHPVPTFTVTEALVVLPAKVAPDVLLTKDQLCCGLSQTPPVRIVDVCTFCVPHSAVVAVPTEQVAQST